MAKILMKYDAEDMMNFIHYYIQMDIMTNPSYE